MNNLNESTQKIPDPERTLESVVDLKDICTSKDKKKYKETLLDKILVHLSISKGWEISTKSVNDKYYQTRTQTVDPIT